MLECTKHMGIDYCPETNSVENGLEGRGNSDWRKVQSLGPRFRMNRTNTCTI